MIWISRMNRSGPSAPASSGLQHLDRDGPVVLQVVREVDRGHAAPPELALDAVAIAQGVRELWGWCGHQVTRHRREEVLRICVGVRPNARS